MKASGWTILALISVTLTLSGPAIAQKKTITHSEYGRAVYPELSWDVDRRIHRIETLQESTENGVVVRSQTTVSEGLPPNRSRYYTKTIADGKTAESEQITIDYMRYTRTDGGPWTKIDLRQQTLSGYSSGGSGANACTQYTVENTFLEGIATKLFESVQVTAEASELKFEEERNWLDEEGLPRRTEEVRGKLYPRVEQNRRVVTYDYNPELKIEAPIN